MEAKAVGVGTVTFQGLEKSIHGVLTNMGVPRMVDAFNAQNNAGSTSSSNSSSSSPSIAADGHQIYTYEGRLHRVPADFELPRGTTLLAWQLYVCGDDAKRYPPLRRLQPSDIGSNKNKRKRFSDYNFIMKMVMEKVKADHKWVDNPSLTQANEMFTVGEAALSAVLAESDVQVGGRKRKRSGQMRWTTVAKLLRLAKKSRTHPSGAPANVPETV